jgi:hypothetical protein
MADFKCLILLLSILCSIQEKQNFKYLIQIEKYSEGRKQILAKLIFTVRGLLGQTTETNKKNTFLLCFLSPIHQFALFVKFEVLMLALKFKGFG